jgi:hypothetical protein
VREGVYPRIWRTARLVLLRKEGRPLDSPLGYRPICLLDEVGKLFERVIAARLEAHTTQREPGWHSSQYGFRQGCSTVDAVGHARRTAEKMVTHQRVALAVSLDIINAFNSIPWNKIIGVLRYHQIPRYLVEVIQAYLNDRWIEFNGKTGITRRPVEWGVPH